LSLGVQILEQSPVLAAAGAARHSRCCAQAPAMWRPISVVLAGNALLQGIAPELESRVMPVRLLHRCHRAVGRGTRTRADRQRHGRGGRELGAGLFPHRRRYTPVVRRTRQLSTLPPPNLRSTMQRRMRRVFPQLADVAIEQVWGGFVDVSRNRAPHWGRLGANVYFAQGFSGHGVAATGLAGRVIARSDPRPRPVA
jgi:gamma-glutamylputrescine oxidase